MLSRIIIFACMLFVLASCKREAFGELKVLNDSNQTIHVKYCTEDKAEGCDTIILIITPGTNAVLESFESSKRAASFNCCPCEAKIFSVTKAGVPIKKDPTKAENWNIPNRSELKKPVKTAVRCEFTVTNEDL